MTSSSKDLNSITTSLILLVCEPKAEFRAEERITPPNLKNGITLQAIYSRTLQNRTQSSFNI